MKNLLTILLLLTCGVCFGQNLVPNPSFEVYDFADRLPKFGFIPVLLLFIVIGIGIHIHHKKIVESTATGFGINKRKYGMAFGAIYAAFAGFLLIILVPATFGEYFRTKSIYDKKQYLITEGIVENYQVLKGVHESERFTVNGIEFKFINSDVNDYGYNKVASNGGAIKGGVKFRIGYFNNGYKNVILKLEKE